MDSSALGSMLGSPYFFETIRHFHLARHCESFFPDVASKNVILRVLKHAVRDS